MYLCVVFLKINCLTANLGKLPATRNLVNFCADKVSSINGKQIFVYGCGPEWSRKFGIHNNCLSCNCQAAWRFPLEIITSELRALHAVFVMSKWQHGPRKNSKVPVRRVGRDQTQCLLTSRSRIRIIRSDINILVLCITYFGCYNAIFFPASGSGADILRT